MENINSVTLTGNVIKDIGEKDFGYIGNEKGTAKLSVVIAVNENVKKNGEWVNEPSFFEVVLWGKLAETLKPYIHKGKGIAVSGRLRQDRWEKDGVQKSKVYVNADVVQLLGGGKDKSSDNNAMPVKTDADGFQEDPVF